MAGLAGALGQFAGSPVARMLSAIRHRGESEARTRRSLGDALALELGCRYGRPQSRGEACPLAEKDGRALAFDGWISNAGELRRALEAEGLEISQASAAELLLEALIRWGDAGLARIRGSWALAFADGPGRQLRLARDPLGTRPLYLHAGDAGWFFASEIKGILEGAGGRFAVDPQVAGDFLEQNLLDVQPETFFAGIRAIPAGHRVTLDCARPPAGQPEPAAFWTIPARDGFEGSQAERIEAVRERLEDAVGRALTGAERVGLLVSGGVDSSAVAAAACAVRRRPELVFLSGVDPIRPDPKLDRLCERLGHRTHRFSMAIPAQDALPDLETVTGFHDEPVRSFAIVAGYRLKQEASRLGLYVLLGGFGSDEIFAGRPLHLVFQLQWLLRSREPLAAARLAAQALRSGHLRPRFRTAIQQRFFPSREQNRIDVRGPLLRTHRRRYHLGLGAGSCQQRLLEEITRFSLPALVHYDDRITTPFGMEGRYPFLDADLVELVAPMSPGWKLRDGVPKWLLRKAMEPRVPKEILWQPAARSGGDAYGDWLRRDLQAPIQRLLGGELASAALGLLDPDALRRHYAAFCGQRGVGGIPAQDVFGWLALESWARRFAPWLRAS